MKEYYQEGKNGKSILLIHGFGGDIEQIKFIFDYFSKADYSVAIPILHKFSTREACENQNPEDWLKQISKKISDLAQKDKELFLIGYSFGGNLAIHSALENKNKIKGIAVIETPVFFKKFVGRLVFWVIPILRLFGVRVIKKDRTWYRENYEEKKDPIPFIPLKVFAWVYNFTKKKTQKEIKKLKTPVLAIQAEKSDLVEDYSAQFIYDGAASAKKEIFQLASNSHDINLMDFGDKAEMCRKIEGFFKSI